VTQAVGTTDTCNHSYCFSCLLQWAMQSNTCPIDRQTFKFILLRRPPEGEILSRIPAEIPTQQSEDEDDVLQDVTYCEVCNECFRQDSMLLCGFCDAAYHTECLDTPLHEWPLGQWMCPLCFRCF
jgi:PHD and RING finger domain-containing protein 1